MNFSVQKSDFSSAGQGATLATFSVPADLIGFAVRVTSVTGAPTNYVIAAYPVVDNIMISDGSGLNTGAKASPGAYPLDLWGSTVIGPVFRNAIDKWRLVAIFSGGTSPTISGTAYALVNETKY